MFLLLLDGPRHDRRHGNSALTSSPAPWLTGWRDEKNEARDGTHSGDDVTKLVKAVPVRMSSSISGVFSGAQLLGRPRPQSS